MHAAVNANTYAIYGAGQVKELTELMPSILNQLGPDSLASLRKLAESYQSVQGQQGGADDEDDDDDPRDHIRAQSEPTLPGALPRRVRHARQAHTRKSPVRDLSPVGCLSRGESSASTPRAYTPAIAEDMPSSSSSSYVMS